MSERQSSESIKSADKNKLDINAAPALRRGKSIKITKGRNGRADKIELIVNIDLVEKLNLLLNVLYCLLISLGQITSLRRRSM